MEYQQALKQRLISMAQTAYEEAGMAVKAITEGI
jgi:hypothetical protein